jgi:hypothetical protein
MVMVDINLIKISKFEKLDYDDVCEYFDYMHTDYKPIRCLSDNSIVDGRHRFCAARFLGFTQIDVEYVADDYINSD